MRRATNRLIIVKLSDGLLTFLSICDLMLGGRLDICGAVSIAVLFLHVMSASACELARKHLIESSSPW